MGPQATQSGTAKPQKDFAPGTRTQDGFRKSAKNDVIFFARFGPMVLRDLLCFPRDVYNWLRSPCLGL